ncbi:hypothetical protein PMAG_a2863 [Pseudoalteromonas mariniglutinosa NCIMB 1770]|nr:hypothetical protein [Pseudoalteromonas mariniglutinosa NCIMB 1770]
MSSFENAHAIKGSENTLKTPDNSGPRAKVIIFLLFKG